MSVISQKKGQFRRACAFLASLVLALSLGLSWVLALTQTPIFGNFILRAPKSGQAEKDPYDNKFYNGFVRLLAALIRNRWKTILCVLALFVGALYTMSRAPQGFFPNLNKPYFRADCFLPDGYSIRESEREIMRLAEWLQQQPSVRTVSVTVGASPLRYYLASTSFGPKPNFGNILVELNDIDSTAALERRFYIHAKENSPNVLVRSSLFKLSPAVEATIQMGFIGEDIDTLERLTVQAQRLMAECDLVGDIRSDWGNKIPVVKPLY